MFESIIVENIIKFGLPLVLIILFLRGLIIAKPISATLLISTYTILTGATSLSDVVIITSVTAVATTLGAIVIYKNFQDNNKNKSSQVDKYIPDKIAVKIESIYTKNKFSKKLNNNVHLMGIFIFISNVIPGFRHMASIPAGKNGYNIYKFILLSYFSTFIYHTTFTYIIIQGIDILFFDIA